MPAGTPACELSASFQHFELIKASTEDVLFETMAVPIFVDCVVIEEVCHIGDLVAWDIMVLTAILVLLKEQLPCL